MIERFGKFMRLHVPPAGALTAASVEHYLLEKSRVVAQAAGERNYHAFYALLARRDGGLASAAAMAAASALALWDWCAI